MRVLTTALCLSGYVLLVACAPTRSTDERGQTEAKASIAWEGAVAALGVASGSQSMRLELVDVGAGNCVLVQCPQSNEALIIDCGTIEGVHHDPPQLDRIRARQQRALARLRPMLEERDVRVIVTHPHSDHMIFLPTLLRGMTVKGIWLGGNRREYVSDPDLPAQFDVSAWLDAQKQAGVPIWSDKKAGYDSDGMQEPDLACGAAKVSVLTTNVGKSQNSRSLVTQLEYGNFSAIFPGDAEGSTEDRILRRFGSRLEDTSLLVAAHHGARSQQSNQVRWAQALRAQVVIYSAGTLHGHPTCTAVERYRTVGSLLPAAAHDFQCKRGSTVIREPARVAEYVTELSGPITVRTDGSSANITCANGCSGE